MLLRLFSVQVTVLHAENGLRLFSQELVDGRTDVALDGTSRRFKFGRKCRKVER